MAEDRVSYEQWRNRVAGRPKCHGPPVREGRDTGGF